MKEPKYKIGDKAWLTFGGIHEGEILKHKFRPREELIPCEDRNYSPYSNSANDEHLYIIDPSPIWVSEDHLFPTKEALIQSL